MRYDQELPLSVTVHGRRLHLFGQIRTADSTQALADIMHLCIRPAKELEEETWPAKTDMAVDILAWRLHLNVHRTEELARANGNG